MKIAHIHNWHRFGGGSEIVVETTVRLLQARGHQVIQRTFDSRQFMHTLRGKVSAFFSGIYSPAGRKSIRRMIAESAPDIVHIHEVYPFFSPWILKDLNRAGIPVVMTCHDYRLTCPISTHFRNGETCTLCRDKNEWQCLLNNCRNNVFESAAFALRSVTARALRLFTDNVTCYTTPSQFVKDWLVQSGFPAERIFVLPNVNPVQHPEPKTDMGCYIGYVGRISGEKGIGTLLDAARTTGRTVRLAGDYSAMPELVRTAPANVEFIGKLNRDQLAEFYRHAQFVVVPSTCLETFGLVALEAMSYGLPVVASRTGGLQEIIDDGRSGFLFEKGNAAELADIMKRLWGNSELIKQMGQVGRERAIREYNEDTYYSRLNRIYTEAMTLSENNGHPHA
ncbi:MAG: glycosyltransferase family 4 protein [Candidatus Zhuqueibacterota bacterium]